MNAQPIRTIPELIEILREITSTLCPDSTYASLVIETPGRPDTVIGVKSRPVSVTSRFEFVLPA